MAQVVGWEAQNRIRRLESRIRELETGRFRTKRIYRIRSRF